MGRYTVKRISLFIPTVLLMTILVFVVMRIIPGDPAIPILEGDGGGSYTIEDLERVRAELGTDRNLFIQYVDWIGGIMQGDFGGSFWFKSPVMTELGDRIPRTLELAVMAIVIAVLFSVPLGIMSAIKPDSWLDLGARTFTIIGIAIPNLGEAAHGSVGLRIVPEPQVSDDVGFLHGSIYSTIITCSSACNAE